MKLDSTVPPAIVSEDCLLVRKSTRKTMKSTDSLPKDNYRTETNCLLGWGREERPLFSLDKSPLRFESSTSWSYLFIRTMSVAKFEAIVTKDVLFQRCGFRYFIHKSYKYKKRTEKSGVEKRKQPTISGLVFLQGRPSELQAYLNQRFYPCRLVKDRSTGRVAAIPDAQMQPFCQYMQLASTQIQILTKPIDQYAKGQIRLRVLTGLFAGQEGYLVRIARDRKLVIDFGGLAVAIGGVHGEQFEEIQSIHTNRP